MVVQNGKHCIFMIYFFLFFRISIVQGDHLSIKALSLTKRVFIYFHSKKNDSSFELILNKQWDQFSSLLEKNNNEGTYEVDYDENVEFCEYYLVKKNELPCFLVLDRRTISLFTKKDIITSYNSNTSIFSASNELQQESEKLNNNQLIFQKLLSNCTNHNLLETACPTFSPKSANYPAFVFHSGDIQNCKKIRRFSLMIPHISDHFYFSTHVSSGVFYFYMNEKDFIFRKMKKSKSLQLIREYSFFPFGSSWKLTDIRQIKERRVAFVVYSSKTNHPLYDSGKNYSNEIQSEHKIERENEYLRNMIYHISNIYWKTIVFNKMTLDDFNRLKFKMKESDTPFIFVTNSRKSKFMILKNITLSNQEKLIRKLKRISHGYLDNEMDITFEPLLSVFYEHSRTLLNTLCFTFVALTVVTITTMIIVKRASQCINPYYQFNNRRKHLI